MDKPESKTECWNCGDKLYQTDRIMLGRSGRYLLLPERWRTARHDYRCLTQKRRTKEQDNRVEFEKQPCGTSLSMAMSPTSLHPSLTFELGDYG